MMATLRDVLDVFGLDPERPVRVATCGYCGGARWRVAGDSWACVGCSGDITGPFSPERQAVFEAGRAPGFPWLRLRPWRCIVPQGAVALGEAGWRLFVSVATSADLDAAWRARARGDGIRGLSPTSDEVPGGAGSPAPRLFATGRWQVCLRCDGTCWWHDDLVGDLCAVCHPPPTASQRPWPASGHAGRGGEHFASER
jgi:hypothetical protein